MRPILLSTFWTAALVCSSAAQFSRAVELPDKFVDEYSAAAEKLKQAYTHGTFKGTYTLDFPQAGGQARTLDFAYRVDGARMRLDESNIQHFEDGLPSGVKYSRVRLITPGQSLWADQPSAGEPFEFNRQDAEQNTSSVQSTTLLNWVYCYEGLANFAPSSDLELTSYEETVVDGRPAVAFDFQWTTDSEGTTVFWTARYLLSPSEGWALRESSSTSRVDEDEERGQFRVRIEYDGMRNGLPLVKRIVDECARGPKFDVYQRQTVEITSVELRAPEASAFTPATCERWLRQASRDHQ